MSKKSSVEDLDLDSAPQSPPQEKAIYKFVDTRPSVGRIVHYYPEDDSKPMAAIVNQTSDVDLTVVGLTLFDPRGDVRSKLNVAFSESPKGSHWNWPPK
jgi:hypothetical protein